MDGNIYDQFGEAIDRRLGGVRVEAQRRAAAGPPPPAMFRLWQEKEEPPFGVEEEGSDEEVTQGLRGGSATEETIIIESDNEDEEEKTEPPSVLFEKMKDLLDKMGRYQQKLVGLCKEVKGWKYNIPTVFLFDSGPESAPRRPGVNMVGSCPQPGIRGRPLTPQARLAQAARTRNQAKASTSQEPPRGEHEPGRRKEAVEVEDDDDEEEEDEGCAEKRIRERSSGQGKREPGERSDFTKTAMPRGGKGTRPPQRPLGASGGYERHEPRQRESTLVYNDGDIELFLDSFWEHARRMGWTVTQAIERLRGAGRFEEPIARIRREATTRQEVEMKMEELRPSPVGPYGRPIRLEIGNASDFIPAFEWFMQEQGILRDDWIQTLPLWTRKAERPLAMQIRDMA
ncbi:hypothetical protein CBR_g52342 [Chara braunii]|uniref:Uncharacterized protein n=1 Tax=Chara braunii TaxID=69332 RepID=A0A388K6R8_CHABU|nr:hypothetical protein CBR_g52342 [Chara braunii]|eukprot:GBG65750.1 hypothetical protein CBR_g52342 [Chara braunii]